MKKVLLVFAVVLILTACSFQKDSGDAKQNYFEESAEEAVNTTVQVEDGATEEMQVEEDQEEKTEKGGYAAVDQFYKEFVSNNTSKNSSELSSQVEELSKKYGLYSDSKNTGLGVRYYKVAASIEEASLINNDDLSKGTYYVYIIGDFRSGSPSVNLVDNRMGTVQEATQDTGEEEPETIQDSTSGTTQTNVMDNETFLAIAKEDIPWALGPRDRIEDISIEDKNLILFIYLTQNDHTVERFIGITDHILEIKDGYDLWDTITVDFGSLGSITKSKDDIYTDAKGAHFSVDKTDIVTSKSSTSTIWSSPVAPRRSSSLRIWKRNTTDSIFSCRQKMRI